MNTLQNAEWVNFVCAEFLQLLWAEGAGTGRTGKGKGVFGVIETFYILIAEVARWAPQVWSAGYILLNVLDLRCFDLKKKNKQQFY